MRFYVGTNSIPDRDARMSVAVNPDELRDLIEAGLVRIVPEFAGETGSKQVSRQEILSFLTSRENAMGQGEER